MWTPELTHYTAADVPTLMHNQIENRTDIEPVMEEIEADIYESPVSLKDLQQSSQGLDGIPLFFSKWQARKTWDKLKPQRNATFALLSSEFWNAMSNNRTTFVFPAREHEALDDIPKRLNKETKILTHNFVDEWEKLRDKRIIQLPHDQWSTHDTAYERLKKITNFGYNNFISEDENPAATIKRGINTAGMVMWGVIGALPEIANQHGIRLGPREAENIIRKAYGPIITRFARMHIDLIDSIFKAVLIKPQNTIRPSFFTLTKNPAGQYVLGIDHAKLWALRDWLGRRVLTLSAKSLTTGCPGLFAKGQNKNIIREYFEWNMQLANIHYFPRAFPQKNMSAMMSMPNPVIAPAD